MGKAPTLPFRLLLLLLLLVVYLSIQLHEAGHWAAGWVVGVVPVMGFTRELRINAELNEALEHTADLAEALHQVSGAPGSLGGWMAFTAAGPLVTLALAVLGHWLFKAGRTLLLRELGLLLVGANALRVVSYLASHLRGSRGDEFFMAFYLGLPQAAVTLPLGLAFTAILFFTFRALAPRGERRRFTLVLVLVGLTGATLSSLLTRADDQMWAALVEGNLLVQPVGGYPLPVALINLVALTSFLTLLALGARPPLKPDDNAL
jgi:hypothetical protein